MNEKTLTLPPLDEAYLEETLLQLLAIPSPVGLTDAIVRYVAARPDALGIPNVITRRGARDGWSAEVGYGDYDTQQASVNGAPATKYITPQENSTKEACPKSGCSASIRLTTSTTIKE